VTAGVVGGDGGDVRSGTASSGAVRVWRGWTRSADADAYERYMLAVTPAAYRAAAGNRGVWMTRRDVGDNTEFCMITMWDSVADSQAFSAAGGGGGGEGAGQAVFFAEDDRYLVQRDLVVSEYTVFYPDGGSPDQGDPPFPG
jgi:heme-degrading monooxygenase HmoA